MKNKNIKSYEDACKVLNVAPITDEAVAAFPAEDRKSLLAYHKLTVIARALNGDWKPDWSNPKQWKYYPWFWFEGNAGLSSADTRSAASYTNASIGSRLCYHDDETARYAGNTFKELYEDFYCWDWENSPAASDTNQPKNDQPEAVSDKERSPFLTTVIAASKELQKEVEKHEGCALVTIALDSNVGKDKDTDVAVSMTGKGGNVVAAVTAFLTAEGTQKVVKAARKRVAARELHEIIAGLLDGEDEDGEEDNNEPENKE